MKTEEQLLRAQELAEEAELAAERGEVKQDTAPVLERRKWRKAMAEALVDGWHGDLHMSRVVHKAWLSIGEDAANTEEFYKKPAEMIGVKYIHSADRAQVWIAKNMRSLNEMLWAGRRRDMCIVAAQKACGMQKSSGRPFYKSARQEDKRFDWNVVK